MSDRAPDIDYECLAAHYERCLDAHGPTAKGVDWPNEADLTRRFEVMLSVIRNGDSRVRLLDLGCGPGLLLDHLDRTDQTVRIEYVGLDISAKMVNVARSRWPNHEFIQQDILREPLAPKSVDYVVMNGVLTEKRELENGDMTRFAQALIAEAFEGARVGLAFNAMRADVDWQQDDLFHWPFDDLMAFLKTEVTRHVTIRADYGLYEFTAYLYREPAR